MINHLLAATQFTIAVWLALGAVLFAGMSRVPGDKAVRLLLRLLAALTVLTVLLVAAAGVRLA
jgi:hypothetical protein